MFNRKKRGIALLNALLSAKRADLLKKRCECEFYHEQAAALRTERDDLMQANGEIKRDLETERRQKEELAALLADAQRKLANAEWREKHRKAAHGNAADRPACPTDCVRHANAGPGGSVCRNCTRNPHAVDKYERAAE